MDHPAHPLRVNVGFIAHQPVGYSRDFSFKFPSLTLPPDLTLQHFNAQAMVSRNNQGLLIQVTCQAATSLECVRCLTSIDQPLSTSFTELYSFSAKSATDSGLVLPENHHIDFSPLIREYLILEIPIGPLCKSDCKGLCPICGENRNEHSCQHKIDDIDPRMEKLKSFFGEEIKPPAQES